MIARKAPGKAALELAERNGATHICVGCWKSFVGQPNRCDECGETKLVEVELALHELDTTRLQRTAHP